MRALATERRELIEALVAEVGSGGISAGLLEKDEHLSDALAALFGLHLDGMQLVFCGGSSLSKAHRLIERMSEDADLKVVLSPEVLQLPRAQIRERLSRLKATIGGALAATGLVEDPDGSKALNENRYFRSEWRYQAAYGSVVGLRPYLQVEFTVRTPVLPVVDLPILRLVDQLANRQGEVLQVPTVDLAETVAEKVLSFLRRFAQYREGQMRQDWDVALVRHLYDVHCAYRRDAGVLASAVVAFPMLVETDQKEFGRQFAAFAEHPRRVLEDALQRIGDDAQSQDEYERHLLPLIYGDVRPSYPEAIASFTLVAEAMLASIPR